MTGSEMQRGIAKSSGSFDAVLRRPEFRRLHAVDARLALLAGCLAIAPGGRYLDLVGGNGRVAFAIA